MERSAVPVACADCGAALDPSALSCPACHALTRSDELELLAAQAREATLRKDLASARDVWEKSAALLPSDTVQYRSVRARIAELDAALGARGGDGKSGWRKGAAGIGPLLLLALSKGKLLLLGLTKLSTLLSMVAFAGVYWALYGWAFALGMVFSIYVHEMGHVLTLRHYGIPADAPMFIPGLGAFIRLRRLHITPVQDARVGLAGPLYGLGAAVAALGLSYATGGKAWAAIAHFGAVVNLFNLIPVWQLDGSRGFASLTKPQRLAVLSVAVMLWLATSEPMLLLISLGAAFRMFTKDASQEADKTGLTQFILLLAALTALSVLAHRVTG
jgi:Zn-dependent protease